ncbi:hypothetical protein [Moorena sp. SIO3I6]|nr:hypothetical protein [Moorena sp. SIO3I6]
MTARGLERISLILPAVLFICPYGRLAAKRTALVDTTLKNTG